MQPGTFYLTLNNSLCYFNIPHYTVCNVSNGGQNSFD